VKRVLAGDQVLAQDFQPATGSYLSLGGHPTPAAIELQMSLHLRYADSRRISFLNPLNRVPVPLYRSRTRDASVRQQRVEVEEPDFVRQHNLSGRQESNAHHHDTKAPKFFYLRLKRRAVCIAATAKGVASEIHNLPDIVLQSYAGLSESITLGTRLALSVHIAASRTLTVPGLEELCKNRSLE